MKSVTNKRHNEITNGKSVIRNIVFRSGELEQEKYYIDASYISLSGYSPDTLAGCNRKFGFTASVNVSGQSCLSKTVNAARHPLENLPEGLKIKGNVAISFTNQNEASKNLNSSGIYKW